MSLEINKLPQDIRSKIKRHMDKIKTLDSKELLDYSIALNDSKEDIELDVRNYLLNAVALRTNTINSGQDVVIKCKEEQMIKNFLKDNK